MFNSKGKQPAVAVDWTKSLREKPFYKLGHLRSFSTLGEIVTIAVDPVGGWMAVGTTTGVIHIIGSAAFQCTLYLTGGRAGSKPPAVKFLTFHPGATRLICIDASNTLHSWYLGQGGMDDLKGTPTKEITTALYGEVTFVETPSPSHNQLFLSMRDGTTLAFDLARRVISPYKIINCWAAHVDRLVRSGVPGRNRQGNTPMATCMAAHPRDLNILLIGYEGGVVAWDMSEKAAVKIYEMTLTPGAPGGSSYHDPQIWKERSPAVTCITWRPDGLVFAVGYDDGCFAIWAFDDPDKPLMVRTIEREDVNAADAESLYDAGALDNQMRRGGPPQQQQPPGMREPIFKLAWVSFPDTPSLTALIAAQGTDAAGEPLSNATVEYAEKGETLLAVLGGCLPSTPPAVNLLQFPPYSPPIAPKIASTIQTEGLTSAQRSAFRDSLSATGATSYPTATPAEDFVLLPRSSPYFSLNHDPVAIFIILTPDPNLPPLNGPQAARGVEAYAFPPPRSGVPPPITGRKEYLTPTLEGQQVAMTSAPMSPGSSALAAPANQATWRMPWSSAPASPNIMAAYTAANISAPVRPAQPLRMPAMFWSGGSSVLGCEIYTLDTPAFKRLISWSIETMGREDKPRVPLRGGVAMADLASHGAPDPKNIKLEPYRIMVTYSADGSVRFWDLSPHILVLPNPLRFEYPAPLPHLTISVTNILRHESIAHLPLARYFRAEPSKVRITSVQLAQESLEMVIGMSTGEVFLYKFSESKSDFEIGQKMDRHSFGSDIPAIMSPKGDYFPESFGQDKPVEELTPLGHLANNKADGFKPVVVLTVRRGPVTATSMSDIGFLAVGYANKSMTIVDMRGPDVILREGFNEEGGKVKKKKKASHNIPAENQIVSSLEWTVARLGADATPAPRLIVSYAKGLTKIFTLSNVLGEWVVDVKALTFSHDALSGPLGSFVLELDTAKDIKASAEGLSMAMRAAQGAREVAPNCVWVATAKKAIRTHMNFSGERLAKVELADEEFVKVAVVTKNGNKVLMCVTTAGFAVFYSLPMLDFIIRTPVFIGSNERGLGRLSVDVKNGDFIEYVSPVEIHLRTLFHHRKPLLPRLDPSPSKPIVAPQPVPLTATTGVASWIWGGAPMTGYQLDTLLAGPAPPPVVKPARAGKSLASWGEPATPASPKPARAPASPVRKAAAPQEKYERRDVYAEMTQAAQERGLTLDNLETQMNGMAVAASDMVKNATKVAAKESAKATAGVMGRAMFSWAK